jgi:hypothetical protein
VGASLRTTQLGMMKMSLQRLSLFFCLANAVGANDIPDTVRACLASPGVAYEVSKKMQPTSLKGDFDGDGKADYAVAVTRGRAQGVMVCWGTSASPTVLGAGVPFNDMKDLDFTSWSVHRKTRRVARGMGSGRAPVLSGDALLLGWESGSGIVYWNGKRFMWYQQGD